MELVRHRLCAFSQESTRYVDYSDDAKTEGHCQFIIPLWCPIIPEGCFTWDMARQTLITVDNKFIPIVDSGSYLWLTAMQEAEDSYKRMADLGWKPQQARSVLPNSTKTEIVMSTNLREWRHVLKMRTSSQAHPQIREIMMPLLNEFKVHLPEIFDDIEVK